MIRNTWTALAVAGVLGLTGCGPTHREADADDRGLVDVDHIGGKEIEEAVRDIAKKLSVKNAEGWPAHIRMSSDTPPKPQLRIDDIVNDTMLHVNVMDLKNELMNQLVEQNVVYVVGYREGEGSDADAIMEEREYQNTMGTQGAVAEMGTEDASGLLLRGEISDDVIEVDGVKQHDYWFSLRLMDTVKGRAVLTTRTKMRRVRD